MRTVTESRRSTVGGALAALAAAASIGLAGGCDARRPPSAFVVSVTVESDPGAPLAGAAVEIEGKAAGTTGADGQLRARLGGEEGAALPVKVACPAGHRQPAARTLVLRTIRSLEPGGAPRDLVIRFACPPALREVAVVVRAAGGAGLPVVIHGQEVARTDASGAAHLSFRLPPGSPLRVGLDTSASPGLRPVSPGITFRLADEDEVFVFDQAFEEIRKPSAPPRRPGPRPRRHRRSTRPERIP